MNTSTRRRFLQQAIAGVGGMLPLGRVRAGVSGTAALRVDDFLNSLGACSGISRRGEKLAKTIEAVKFLGLRWFRVGYESNIPVDDLLSLHEQTGARFSYGLMSGGTDVARLLAGARELAAADALLALEGPSPSRSRRRCISTSSWPSSSGVGATPASTCCETARTRPAIRRSASTGPTTLRVRPRPACTI